MRFKAKLLARAALLLVAIAAVAYLVMLLWNNVVPGVFLGAQTLNYRQALGLLILCRILFGGFRGRGGRGGRHWRRLGNLTPEERARFQRAGCTSYKESEGNS
jgi:hypothetical protein